jgi:hypothetical protein
VWQLKDKLAHPIEGYLLCSKVFEGMIPKAKITASRIVGGAPFPGSFLLLSTYFCFLSCATQI